jgi:hypothetical protein
LEKIHTLCDDDGLSIACNAIAAVNEKKKDFPELG